MKRIAQLVLVISLVFFFGCQNNEDSQPENLPAGTHKVKVLEHTNASNYTYLRVEENGNEYWMAVPQMNIEDGDMVYYSQSMEMKNFESKGLGKTFDTILFVQDASMQAPAAQPNMTGEPGTGNPHAMGQQDEKADVSIAPPKDGKTVAEIFGNREKLAGKEVKVRGKVTKVNKNIMGRNWIHIQDGTSSGEYYDLLVTSHDEATVGDIITASGVVAVDKDFGAGYAYTALVEDAKVTKQ